MVSFNNQGGGGGGRREKRGEIWGGVRKFTKK